MPNKNVMDPFANGMQNGFNNKFIFFKLHAFHTWFAPSDSEHFRVKGDFKSQVEDLKSL